MADSDDSDATLPPSDHEALKNESGKPYEFKKSYSSSYHDISDSSDDEIIIVSTTKKRKLDYKETAVETSLSENVSTTIVESDTDSDIYNAETDVDSENEILVNSKSVSIQKEHDSKPVCKYGVKCYRKNPQHLKEYKHIDQGEADGSPPNTSSIGSGEGSYPNQGQKKRKSARKRLSEGQPLSFFLTTAFGIGPEHNGFLSLNIKDILSPELGTLEASCQFNYCHDISWTVEQYPVEFRQKRLLIVHGEQRQSKAKLDMEATVYPHVTLCQAKMEIMYGTHHTKMMLLLYKEGMRVVIHTANLIERDWYQKTQGVWISPLFPKMPEPSTKLGDSKTHFKRDLLEYISGYGVRHLNEWLDHIKHHSMKEAKVFIIGSIPGRHSGFKRESFGHLKLREVLKNHISGDQSMKLWPVVGQFSSIGSLGSQEESWLKGEWLESLGATKNSGFSLVKPNLKLIFPSVDDVRLSLEGYPAGGSIPYSVNTAKKQQYLHSFFHQWKSDIRGRTRASPHIKTYFRASPGYSKCAWFLVTSCNLSKAAWGTLEKGGSQLMIRSYEIGVLFIPEQYDVSIFKIMSEDNPYEIDEASVFPVPFDLPPTKYSSQDIPWMWDVHYKDKPDSHGNIWCPDM